MAAINLKRIETFTFSREIKLIDRRVHVVFAVLTKESVCMLSLLSIEYSFDSTLIVTCEKSFP